MTDTHDIAVLTTGLRFLNKSIGNQAADALERLARENAELREFDKTKPDAEWREMYEDVSKSAGYQRTRAEKAVAERDHYRKGMDIVSEVSRQNLARALEAEAERDALAAKVAELEAALSEPVRWQRNNPMVGWLEVDERDIAHYREQGQEIRALYARAALQSTGEKP